jgi:hypothetical protein
VHSKYLQSRVTYLLIPRVCCGMLAETRSTRKRPQVEKMATDTTPEAASYRLTLKGHGIAVERDVGEAVAASIIALVMGAAGGTLSVGGALAGLRSSQLPTEIGDTVGEFVQASGASTNFEKIAAVAVFLADRRGQATFSRADIRAQFQIAGEPNPANFPRDFQRAVANRWLAPSDSARDSFFVTNTGRQAVAQGFGSEGRQPLARPARRRPRRNVPRRGNGPIE